MIERVVAVIPVGWLEAAKSRLGAALDAEERRDLVASLLRRTIAAARGTTAVHEVLVISPDREALAIAAAAGARTMRQRSQGLNAGLLEARDDAVAAGATAMLVLPVDLPLVSAGALRAVLEAAGSTAPAVVLVADRHGRGTNALLVTPPDAIPFAFGGDSRRAHAAAAAVHGVPLVELVDSPLRVDIDTPEDLLLAETLAPDAVDAH